jgi:hypothetical protein
MSLLKEIKSQPHATRQLMFVLSVITTISIIGAVWFNSFQRDVFALLNPDEEFEEHFYVEENGDITPLGIAGKGLGALRAGFYGLLNIDVDSNEENNDRSVDRINERVYLFPLSGNR